MISRDKTQKAPGGGNPELIQNTFSFYSSRKVLVGFNEAVVTVL